MMAQTSPTGRAYERGYRAALRRAAAIIGAGVEPHIASLPWAKSSTDLQKTLVAGNCRHLADTFRAAILDPLNARPPKRARKVSA